jgi:radical SAM protein with 4Fe4S-binding SPASM domain
VFTNCLLINTEWAQLFSETSTNVAFSIYSANPVLHDSITGINGSHAQLMRAIDILDSAGVQLRPGYILMDKNEHDQQHTREWLIQRFGDDGNGCDIIRCTPGGRCSSGAHISPTLWEKKLRTKATFQKCDKTRYYQNTIGNSCLYGSLCVHHNGDVYPCVMDRVRMLGRIGELSLAEIIMKNFDVGPWVQSFTKIEGCSHCEFRFACVDCRPEAAGVHALLNKTETVSYDAKNPCCLYDCQTGIWSTTEVFMENIKMLNLNR